MRSLDDKKVGEHKIARLFNTVFSCVGEDLYVIADMSHFKLLYKDRLFTRLLMLLQGQADEKLPLFVDAAKKFDSLNQNRRNEIFALQRKKSQTVAPAEPEELKKKKEKDDLELEMQIKKIAKQRESTPVTTLASTVEQDVFAAVHRVLGWRTDINLLSQFVGGDLIFHNSVTTEETARKLPLNTCENEINFRDVMERWNLLIYEMSGGNKTDMSFLSSKGPEGRVRQDIRSLHAYHSSDVEAAIEEGKKKIAVDVARVFQELLGKNKPGSPTEWSTAYLNFLTRLEAYLNWVSEQVRR
jgi:hypothetical protein